MTTYRATRLATYRASDDTYIRRACQGLPRVVLMARRVARDEGFLGRLDVKVADELDEDIRSWTGLQRLMRIRAKSLRGGELHHGRAARRRAARRDQRSRLGIPPASARRAAHVIATKWAAGVTMRVHECERCGRLLASGVSATPTRMHQQCMVESMQTPAARRWLSERKQMRDAGRTVKQINRALGPALPLSNRGPGRPRLNVHRDFVFAVRHYLGDVPVAELASEAKLHHSTVQAAIARIIDSLPEPGLVDSHFRSVVVALGRSRDAG